MARLAALEGQELNEAKKVLATEATALVHGRAAAEQAAETARSTFEEGALAESLPTAFVPRVRFEEGISIADASILAGFCNSRGEVRRAIANNAITVNDSRITNFDFVIGAKDFTAEGVIKLSFGKKRHVLLKPV